MKKTIFTIGHSNKPKEDFLALLEANKIKQIIDIRTIPRSRHNPQFNEEILKRYLREHKIGYRRIKELGGLRKAKKDSKNIGWRNASFRGFADYMQTPEFWEGIGLLEKIAKKKRTAIMCAEALPWRCHRSLISDALEKKHWQVFGIIGKFIRRHKITPFLHVQKGRFIYS